MKILGVKFKNINSLTGEWEIRFDRSPISDTGLFAIVGPNGSGKSSILDAITLGLYGETPRLKNYEGYRLNFSGNDSYSEVTFSVTDHLYCSRWFVKRSGETSDPPDMSLFSLNGEKKLLEHRVNPVRTRIAELTGLDFKRFCRSILLAQGEFSAFLNALENERAEILEKIIGPEMCRELAESIRSRAEIETERLDRLREEAAVFQTSEKARVEEIRQSVEQAREEAREIGQDLEILRDQERWLERMAQEPDAEKNAAEALRMAEIRHTEIQSSLRRLEEAGPAASFQEAVAQLETLRAQADAIREENRHLNDHLPAREKQIEDLTARIDEIRRQRQAAKDILDSRIGDFQEAENLDRDIAAMEKDFMDKISRLEASMREQQDTSRIRSELEEQEKLLDKRIHELQQWIEAHAADEGLASAIPQMESLVAQLETIRQQMEACRPERENAVKAENRSAKALQRAEKAVRKAQTRADRIRARKTDQDTRLQAIYGGETRVGLKTAIETDKKRLAACKTLKRIGPKGADLVNVPYEQAQSQLQTRTLTESLAHEQSRLQALEGEIRKRDAIRRLESDRSKLQPGEPCPLCGSVVHPFLDEGILDFTELDRIVSDREEKIRTLQAELDSHRLKDLEIQKRVKTWNDMQQEWNQQCALAGISWDFGETEALSEHIRAIRGEIRNAKSRLRSSRWCEWQVKWTDRSLEWKLKTLSKRENALEKSRAEHETDVGMLSRIDQDLARLSEDEVTIRSVLFDHLNRWQERLPEPGDEKTPVTHLAERAAVYSRNGRELTAAENELQAIRSRQNAASETLSQLEETSRHLSDEIEHFQARLNAQKADRVSRVGTLEPIRERQALESEIKNLDAEEQSLSTEVESLRRSLAEDREKAQRMTDQEMEIRKSAANAEKEILEQARAVGYSTLKDIRDGLSILQSEPEILNRLADAENALKTARESVEALRPEYPTTDTLDMVQWKISEVIKHQETLAQEIENQERILEEYRRADREYQGLLNAIAVQEKVLAEAAEAHRSIEKQGGAKLQQLLLQQLLEKANRHLNTLNNGRYVLKSAGPDDLGLYVEDSLQSGALRSVRTLSGGESFVVSLCLALGLSDMAASRRRIESLFLDEGFGKLDDEMLYRVISTLKSLQATGRTIGVVSHVKRLAEEISTQIRLEKGPDGSSRITVVA